MDIIESPWHRFANHEFWNKPIALLLFVFFVISIIGLFRWFFFGSSLSELLIEAIFIVTLVAVGLLKALYPKFSSIVEKGFGYYFYGTFLFFILVGPFAFFLFVAQWAVTDAPIFLQYLVFVLSAILWLSLVATIVYGPWKQWLFNQLKHLGWLLPLVFLANFIMISVVLFGSIGYLVSCHSSTNCQIQGVSPSDINYDLFLTWFLWHVTDAVPAIKIPNTLSWEEPLTIRNGPTWLGLWLVLFKIAVILPGIGAFKAYWSKRKEEQERAPSGI